MDSSKIKKVLFVLIFIVVVIFFGFLLYLAFFRNLVSQPPEPGTVATSTGGGKFPNAGQGDERPGQDGTSSIGGEGLPGQENTTASQDPRYVPSEVAKGGITKTATLNETPSYGMTLSSDGKDVQYYNKTDGKFYRIDKYGDIIPLSDRVFYNVDKITWSPQKDKAILEYPDGSNIVYNFQTKDQVTLEKHWEDFGFSTDGNKIVMKSIGLDPDNRFLAIVNSDGSRATPIDKIGENADKVFPDWSPNNQIIAMHTEGIDFNRQEVYFIGLNNENFKSTVIEGRDFRPMWSKEGDKLLYSVYSSDNGMKPNLWIVNAEGNDIGTNRKSLKLETWVDKCTFQSNTEVYCAVPNKLEDGSGLFPELAKPTIDRLYKIDLNTGSKRIVAIPDEDFNISDIVVSEDGKNLFFTDARTERIHKIILK